MPKLKKVVMPSYVASRVTWDMCDSDSLFHGSDVDVGALEKYRNQ